MWYPINPIFSIYYLSVYYFSLYKKNSLYKKIYFFNIKDYKPEKATI